MSALFLLTYFVAGHLTDSVSGRAGPIVISLAAFSTYSLLGKPLTAAVAFPALALFNLLRFPVLMFPQQITNLINAKISLSRIQKFIEVNLKNYFVVIKQTSAGNAC